VKISIVDSNTSASWELAEILAAQNYAVETAGDREAGWELVEAFGCNLLVLAVAPPLLDGIDLCRQVRSQGYDMPILLVANEDSRHERIRGLNAGADDYVVRPLAPEEWVARVRALLRRGNSRQPAVLSWGELQLDPTRCEVTYRQKPLTLTPKEYALLHLFLHSPERVFSCGMVLEHLWAFPEMPGEDAVRTHIKGLRQKLKQVGAPATTIETVYGIGYRLKPLKDLDRNTPAHCQQPAIATLVEVWQRYREHFDAQVAIVAAAIASLQDGSLTAEVRQAAERAAHSLAGTLGTFGCKDGSRLARQLEPYLQADSLLDGYVPFDNLMAWVEDLQAAVRAHSPEQEYGLAAEGWGIETFESKAIGNRPLLLVIESSGGWATSLHRETELQDLRVEGVTTLAAARTCLSERQPAALLLDLDGWDSLTAAIALLTEVKQLWPSAFVLVCSERASLVDRLEVARLGGDAFLPKPFAVPRALAAIAQVRQRDHPTKTTVLAVDDDPQVLESLQALLTPWGFQVHTLGDPRQFWEALSSLTPELLLLDIKMPHVSGIELCQVVRNDVGWNSVPILILTACTETETIERVFSAGADDFVRKPIVGPELIARIVHRLERLQGLQRLAEMDPLTGIANRHKSSRALETYLSLARRRHQPLCLALLGLDRFQQVNQQYGRAMGEDILRSVGQRLLLSFRSEDVVARWQEEEFLVAMYGTTKAEGLRRLQRVLDTFTSHECQPLLQARERALADSCLTFSGGIAQYPDDGEQLDVLYRAADLALHRAQTADCNCVLAAERPLSQSIG
jgi:diguanylate cyclase (GGDEF)-like protein